MRGPSINFGAVKRDVPLATPPFCQQIYQLIWAYEDRVGQSVPVCLPPHVVMRRADWSVKGDINLLSIYWGLTIQLVSYADCVL